MQTRTLQTDGLKQRILEAGPTDGSAPLVLLIHGFPELGISWRAQVQALAEAGYHAVAPDMRGYGDTERPSGVEAYSILSLVGDMVDLVRALARETGSRTECVVVGHDWGAPVAWHCALLRPQMFRAVFGLSVPFQPRIPKGAPLPMMRAISKRVGRDLYICQFQAPQAHRAFETDVAAALRKGFYAYDGATPNDRQSTGFIAPGQDFVSEIPDDATLPPWMTPDHFAEYVAAFSAGGFDAPLNWYRCLDRNWALMAFVQDLKITVPSAFMVGERDPVRNYSGAAEATLKDWATDLRHLTVVPGAGHWIQQEQPDVVNAALLQFLGGLTTPPKT